MAQHYYDKFNTIANHTPSFGHNPGGSNFSVTLSNFNSSTSYTYGYSYDPSSSIFTGVSKIVDPTSFPGTFYLAGSMLIKYELARVEGVVAYYTRYDATASSVVTNYSKGSLVQSYIAAEDGTYPTNGRHTDGFWYVKGAAVGPMTPGTVTPGVWDLSKAGGRRLVKLNNGWFIAAAQVTDTISFFVSKDKGVNWTQLCYIGSSTIKNNDFAITTNGTMVYCILGWYSSHFGISHLRFDPTTMNGGPMAVNGNIDVSLTALGNMSLIIDPSNGHLHAAWASKNATYPNSFNIRYAKSTDGGVTWSAAEQVTKVNLTDAQFVTPCIVIKNGKAYIFSALKMGTTHYMVVAIQGLAANEGDYNSSYTNWGVKYVDKSDIQYTKLYPSAVVDKDGRFHVAWHAVGDSGVPTYNFVRYAFSDDAKSWSAVDKFGNPDFGYPSISVDKLGTLFILGDNSTVKPLHQLKKNKGGSWVRSSVAYGDTAYKLTYPSILHDPYFNVTFGEFAPAVFEVLTSPKHIKFGGSISTNNAPTITVISPSSDQTLYENDTINLSGDAYDADKDQSVTVFYQINDEQRKVLATNVSQTQITLSKQLMFKDGKLFDGETALTGTLTEGVAHTLKVWAVDSENGQSATIERTFYVVPNRAPLLSVDAVVPAGVIDTDKFKISGTSSDPDANANVKITKKVNANNPVEIYNGPGGAWEFDVSLAELVVGENMIVIEVIDNYGAKTSKTIKLKKNEVKTPILHAVARYKITPPAGSAKGVLLFIERNEDMDLKVELSMTLVGEQEQYETLTANNTAPMPTNGIVEDTFYFETTEPKDNIILKISTTRPDATVNHKIHLISGAVE